MAKIANRDNNEFRGTKLLDAKEKESFFFANRAKYIDPRGDDWNYFDEGKYFYDIETWRALDFDPYEDLKKVPFVYENCLYPDHEDCYQDTDKEGNVVLRMNANGQIYPDKYMLRKFAWTAFYADRIPVGDYHEVYYRYPAYPHTDREDVISGVFKRWKDLRKEIDEERAKDKGRGWDPDDPGIGVPQWLTNIDKILVAGYAYDSELIIKLIQMNKYQFPPTTAFLKGETDKIEFPKPMYRIAQEEYSDKEGIYGYQIAPWEERELDRIRREFIEFEDSFPEHRLPSDIYHDYYY